MNWLISLDNFVIRQADKVLEWLTDWFSLTRLQVLLTLSVLIYGLNLAHDFTHHLLSWIILDTILFLWYIMMSFTVKPTEGKENWRWVRAFWMICVPLDVYIDRKNYNWTETVISITMVLWAIFLATGNDNALGKKRKEALAKLKGWWEGLTSWSPVPNHA